MHDVIACCLACSSCVCCVGGASAQYEGSQSRLYGQYEADPAQVSLEPAGYGTAEQYLVQQTETMHLNTASSASHLAAPPPNGSLHGSQQQLDRSGLYGAGDRRTPSPSLYGSRGGLGYGGSQQRLDDGTGGYGGSQSGGIDNPALNPYDSHPRLNNDDMNNPPYGSRQRLQDDAPPYGSQHRLNESNTAPYGSQPRLDVPVTSYKPQDSLSASGAGGSSGQLPPYSSQDMVDAPREQMPMLGAPGLGGPMGTSSNSINMHGKAQGTFL